MQFDLSLTITSVIALCAIISPIITTYFYSSIDDVKIREEALTSMYSLSIYFTIDKRLQLLMLESFNQRKHQLLNEVITELSKQIEKK